MLDARAAWAAHGFHGAPGDLLAERSLPAAWSARWRSRPDATVVHDEPTGWLLASELDERSAVVAGRLHAAGLRSGDRLIMSCRPSADLVVAHAGALRAGLVVVPVNPELPADAVANLVERSGARLAVADEPERFTAASVPGTGPSVDLDDGAVPELDTSGPDDPALLIFTSGTTGRPKGALLSHGNLLSSITASAAAWRWTADDRVVLPLPLFHMHGLGVGIHGTLLTGGSVAIVPRFSVDAVLDAAAEHQATMLLGVPTMWVRLAASERVGELARLRLCISGSAPLDATTWQTLADRGGQRVLERYGMTETVMNISNPYEGDRRPGSVGLALPGVEVRLASPSDDGVGEIEVRGPNVFAGYWHEPEADAQAFTDDGWFRTGDLGACDPDGYVRIVGRSKDLIITGGYNVYPRDVEEVLRRHPAVGDVAVIGEPSPEWGETVTACVIARSVVEPEALVAFAAEHLVGYQRPRRVVLVDEFPRNALGKVVKADLLARVSAG